MPTNIRFDDQVAIITGAGAGLGREYALELARRGARVLVNDLGGSSAGVGQSADAANAVVEEIRDAGGVAIANHDSVATREGGAAITQAALDAWGRIDICINNAGFLRNARFEDLSDREIDSILDVHLKGAFYVSQPAYTAMRARGYGRFLFTGSASSMYGHAWQANYAAAKGGLMGLSHIVAIEGSAYGIQSNLLLPAARTRLGDEMHAGFMEIPKFAASLKSVDFSQFDAQLTPVFIVPLALYLVSAQCQSTHAIFSANAGRYAQVHICAAEGWAAPTSGNPPSVEGIAEKFGQICDMANYYEPLTVYEEYAAVSAARRRQGVA